MQKTIENCPTYEEVRIMLAELENKIKRGK